MQAVDDALAEIDRLPGRHLYFLDDNLFGSPPFAEALFDGMRGMGRVWQSAGTVQASCDRGCSRRRSRAACAACSSASRRSTPRTCAAQHKMQNLGARRQGPRGAAAGGTPQAEYEAAIRRLHEHGVMVNASFVFGMDDDGPDVFARTVEWASPRASRLHLPHPHAVPGHAARAAPDLAGPGHEPRLGSLRHPPRRVSPGAHDGRAARGRVLGRLSRVLSLERICKAAFAHGDAAGARAAPGVHGRLEEARADVGPRDPQRQGARFPAAAGDDPRPLRQRRRGDAGAGCGGRPGPAQASAASLAVFTGGSPAQAGRRPHTSRRADPQPAAAFTRDGCASSDAPSPCFLICERQPQLAMNR